MKKTIVQLFILLFCFTASQQSFAQKRNKKTSGKEIIADTFYFETSNPKENIFTYEKGTVIDSILFTPKVTVRSLFSSEETDFSLTRSITLSDNSGSKSIPIEISAGSPEFLLSINCNLKSGTLNVEIYDPKGEKRGNFSVKGSGHSNNTSGWSETVGGVINKRYQRPIKGTWNLKFISEKVTADISINTKIR